MINYFGKEGVNLLHKMSLKRWNTQKIPENYTTIVGIITCKMRSKMMCTNQRRYAFHTKLERILDNKY